MKALVINLLTFFLVIFVGYFLRKREKASEKMADELSYFLLNVAIPANMIYVIVKPYDALRTKMGVLALILTIISILVAYGVSIIITKFPKIEKKDVPGFQLGTTFSNNIFMGMPVINTIFGAEGVFLNSFSGIGFQIVLYSLGNYIAMGEKKERQSLLSTIKKILESRAVLACIFGLVLYFLNLPLPKIILPFVEQLSFSATPLSVLVIGLKLGEYDLLDVFSEKKVYFLSFARLIIAPLAFIIPLMLIKLHEEYNMLKATIAILSAMPIAANNTPIAALNGSDTELISKATAFSSIACIITIPIIAFFVVK